MTTATTDWDRRMEAAAKRLGFGPMPINYVLPTDEQMAEHVFAMPSPGLHDFRSRLSEMKPAALKHGADGAAYYEIVLESAPSHIYLDTPPHYSADDLRLLCGGGTDEEYSRRMNVK
jgi:hypothetical protein